MSNDTLNGGANDDFMMGENGNDTLDGGSGNDTLIGQAGADVVEPALLNGPLLPA